jgi:hypothetical protein
MAASASTGSLNSGGDAHGLRNAGGNGSNDAIRLLLIPSDCSGSKIVLIRHIDCDVLTFGDAV